MELIKRFFGVKKIEKQRDDLVAMSPEEYRTQEKKEQDFVNIELDKSKGPRDCDWVIGDFRCYKGQTVVPPYLDEPLGVCNKCSGTGKIPPTSAN